MPLHFFREPRMIKLLSAFMFAAFLTLSAVNAQSYKINPLRVELDTSGSETRGQFTVVNSGAEPVTIDLAPRRLEIAENGDVQETDAIDDFVIFPPQMIVGPKKEQLVRVQYIGSGPAAYYLAFEQVPVSFSEEDVSSVKIGLTYKAMIIVNEPDAKPDVSAEVEGAGDALQLVLKNTGAAHTRLTNYIVEPASGGAEGVALKDINYGASSLLMAGQTRRLPISEVAGFSTVKSGDKLAIRLTAE